jgi:gluconate 2-dehydrogenase subunit 3-like protein
MKKRWTRRRFLAAAGVTTAAGLVLRPATARTASPLPFTPGERALLRRFADEIIPAADGMPSAEEAGAVAYLEALATSDEAVRGQLQAALAAVDKAARQRNRRGFTRLARSARVEALLSVERASPEAFAAARNLVYEGYYTQASVTRRLGYRFVPDDSPGQPLEPFEESLVERVRTAGRLYREIG